jgi:hypothetical protein
VHTVVGITNGFEGRAQDIQDLAKDTKILRFIGRVPIKCAQRRQVSQSEKPFHQNMRFAISDFQGK